MESLAEVEASMLPPHPPIQAGEVRQQTAPVTTSRYHEPHRGLPQELRDMIYEFALCPPEGIVIARRAQGGVQCTSAIAGGLLRASRQVNAVASDIVYSKNVFTLDLRARKARKFLSSVPKKRLSQIKHVTLSTRAMDLRGSRSEGDPESRLASFLCKRMAIESVTLELSPPITAGEDTSDEDSVDEFQPDPRSVKQASTLQEHLLEAFKNGKAFQTFRHAIPAPWKIDTELFFGRESSRGAVWAWTPRALLGGHFVRELHRLTFTKLKEKLDLMERGDCEEVLREFAEPRYDPRDEEVLQEACSKAGFTISRETPRLGENSPDGVMMVRRAVVKA